MAIITINCHMDNSQFGDLLLIRTIDGFGKVEPQRLHRIARNEYNGGGTMDHLVSLGLRQDQLSLFHAEQRRSAWCWAACVQMILQYHGFPVDQDSVVRKMIGLDSRGYPKNKGAEDSLLTRTLNCTLDHNGTKFMIRANYIAGKPRARDIIRELINGCPLIIGYRSSTTTKHAVLVTWIEYLIQEGAPKIYAIQVMDPAPNGVGIKVYNAGEFANLMTAAWTVTVSLYKAPFFELFGASTSR